MTERKEKAEAKRVALLAELAGIVGVKVTDNWRNWTSALRLRLEYLGYAEICSRCDGTGHHEYNMRDGTRCFKCGGAKTVLPSKMSDATKAALRADVQEGKLNPYFKLRDARNLASRARDVVLKVWIGTGIESRYDWRKSYGPDANPEDVRIAAINKVMADQYELIKKASFEYEEIIRKGLDGGDEKALDLAALISGVVETIKEAAKQI